MHHLFAQVPASGCVALAECVAGDQFGVGGWLAVVEEDTVFG